MSIDRRDFLLSSISANAGATPQMATTPTPSLQTQVTTLQNSLTALTASVALQRGYKSIKEFGAKGDGVTDDTGAFQAAIVWVKTQARWTLTGDTVLPRLLGIKIYLPHGDYLIKTPCALLDFDFNVLANAPYGLAFEGEASGGVQIVYQPTTSGPLCYNNACLSFIEFKNINFFCNDPNSDFFDSIGPRSQGYSFNDCYWLGTWRYGLNLTGPDNNSEMRYNHCRILGSFTCFVYGNSTTSDQYISHWFKNCLIWNWCTLIYSDTKGGGHYHLINCDFEGAPSSPTYAIKLMGAYRNEGVTSLTCINCRAEHRNANTLFLYCEWGFGNILIEGCDFGSQASVTSAFSPFYFVRVAGAGIMGPTIKFDSCMLMGNHEYHYNDSSAMSVWSVVYDSCQLMQNNCASDMIIFNYDGAGVCQGAKPVARFANCETFANPYDHYVMDTDVGWDTAHIGPTSAKLMSLKDPAGNFPHNGTYGYIELPKNVVVTKVTWYSKPGENGGNTSAYSYRIRSNEFTPTILSTVSGSNVSAGFGKTDTPFFQCSTTDATRIIVFEDTAGQSSVLTNSYVIVEYIG
jgi:Pectate lyase superfamily protein